MDFTGCGNSLNLHPRVVLQLVLDSLRYWVEEMHVDGFRFDLATSAGTGTPTHRRVRPHGGASCDEIRQDPVLSPR